MMQLSAHEKIRRKKYLHALLCFSALASTTSVFGAPVSVTNTADSGAGSLRAAITQINTSGIANSIQFNLPGATGTITLASPLPPIGPLVTGIEINSNTVTIDGGSLYQPLFIYQTNPLFTVSNPSGVGGLTLLNTASIGGNGGGIFTSGGGGALGAGGGIFVAPATGVTIQGVTFSGCRAVGGNGGSSGAFAGGGGGGGGMNGGNGGATTSGGGGGGGYDGNGGSSAGFGGGGGGGLFFAGGSGNATGGGGGGGSDAASGSNATAIAGGSGATGSTGVAGTGGAAGMSGGTGTGTSGGGGGGPALVMGVGGAGGNSNLGAGGGGSGDTVNGTAGGAGGNSLLIFGGGGGGGGTSAGGPGAIGGSGGLYAGGGGSGMGAAGGAGSFGGGGGGAGQSGATFGQGGNGGYGAGGGGGGTGGTAGFGGGKGGGINSLGGGGGGAALGGAIFVGSSSVLTIQDPIAISGSSITAGTGGSGGGADPGANGTALGTDIFIMATGLIDFLFANPATTLTIGSSIQSDTVSGGGTGGIAMLGAGKLILSGNNNYAGATILGGTGTIQISNDNNLGAINNHIAFLGGTLEMSAAVTSARAVDLVGAAIFQTDAGTSTFSGTIAGLGPLNKIGAATLALTNSANTYTGGTILIAGTLQVSSAGSIGTGPLLLNGGTFELLAAFASQTLLNPIAVNASAIIQSDVAAVDNPVFSGPIIALPSTLTINQTNASLLTLSGNISGPVGLQMNGPGTLILSGTNTNSGTTTISSGTLRIDSNSGLSSASNVTNNAALVFNNSGTGTYGGSISGTGTLTMQGSGSMALTGSNSYSGNTTVQAGTLFVDGSLTASATTVNSGGTLGGVGQVQSVIVNGTLAPGDNSVGTLAGSNFTFNNGSDLFINFNNTSASLVAATNNVTINPGANLTLNPLGFSSPQVLTYTIITASNVTTNAQFNLVNSLESFGFQILYAPTEVILLVDVAPYSLFLPDGNAKNAAVCFQTVAAKHPADLTQLVQILDLQLPSQLEHSFNQMQPADFDNIAYAEENVAERIRQVFTRHFYEQRVIACPEQRRFRAWLVPFAEKVRQYGHDLLHGYKERFAGVTAAGDYRLKKNWMFSGGFSYAASELKIPHGKARADFKTYAGSFGAVWTNTKWFADAILSYLYSPIHAKRHMHFSVQSAALTAQQRRKATHHDRSNQGLAHLGGGYDYSIQAGSKANIKLYPFLNLDYLYSHQAGYKEKGAESLDLKVHGKAYDFLRPEAGIGIGYQGCFKEIDVMADISASYVLEFRFLGKSTQVRFKDSSCQFTVHGLNPENNVICPTARLRLANPIYGFSMTLGYHGEFGSRFRENAVEAELRKAF